MKRTLVLFVPGLLAVLVFLSLKAVKFSSAEHERFQSALWRMKQLDTTLNMDLLEARFGLMDNYDGFDSCVEELNSSLNELKTPPSFVGASGRVDLENARTEYASISAKREELLEEFKSTNASLANSRRYLPTALNELAARLGEAPTNRELEYVVGELARLTLVRLSNPDDPPDESLARLRRIEDWCSRHPNDPEKTFVSSLDRHAKIIVKGNGDVDALTRRLLALPSGAAIQSLSQAYESNLAIALHRSQQYRLLLYALAIVLLAGIIYTLWALRNANRKLERRVQERTRELARTEERFRLITENVADLIAIIDAQGRQTYCSPSYSRVLGLQREDFAGEAEVLDLVHPQDRDLVISMIRNIIESGTDQVIEYRIRHRDGSWRTLESHGALFRNDAGSIEGVLAVARDISERKEAEKARQFLEVQLRQSQKLEAVGQLSAGIAHEINTPTQYIGDNTRFVRDSFESIATVLKAYAELHSAARRKAITEDLIGRVDETVEANDLGYLFEQVPAAIAETLEGVDRVTKIVRAMKEFSHPGSKEKSPSDLNKAIETTVTVAHSEWKYVAEMKLELDPGLPIVPCFLSEFNQCILNLIVNAAHAIGDVVKQNPGTKGIITVRTRRDREHVEVRVSDTGTGIPESARSKIFEPFFTTKDVGKGTGQGLSIVYASIMKKHGGTVSFETETGRGTTFILSLPIGNSVDGGSANGLQPAPAQLTEGSQARQTASGISQSL